MPEAVEEFMEGSMSEIGRIIFGPPSEPRQTAAQAAGPSQEQIIAGLRRQLAAARSWYDAEYPAEEGHDQVYPWD